MKRTYGAVLDGSLYQCLGDGVSANLAGAVDHSIEDDSLGEDRDWGRCTVGEDNLFGRHYVCIEDVIWSIGLREKADCR